MVNDIASETKNLRFIVQDRPGVVEEAKKYWQTPERVSLYNSGKVSIQAHDFFTPQPVKDADVFMLRMICHDHSDEDAKKILMHLRKSAKADTKLMIVEQVVPFACVDTTEAMKVKGYVAPHVPEPLLPNFGKANTVAYFVDVHMNNLFLGKERTLTDFVTLGKETGWEVEQMYELPGSIFKQVIATPVNIPSKDN